MTLPRWLLEAIVRAVPDQDEARRVACEWNAVLPELEAAADRIRAKLAAVVRRCESGPVGVQDGRCGRCFGGTE